ncbi:MAG: radical SAM protein [Planctomycetes bacterium]|nr:radical SAM protein [Planctomycetota bacterium]
MKIIAAIFADFAESFLGGPAALERRLGPRTVIEHTLRRLLHVEEADGRCLLVRPRDREAAQRAVQAAGAADRVDVLPLDDGVRVRRGLIRSARKWGLESWRGTPLGTTWFDEFVEPMAVGRVLDHYQADGVLCFDGSQAVLDPVLASGMTRHARENAAEADFVFSQAPPGLTGLYLGRQVTRDLLENNWPFGLLLAYRPEMPRGDLITRLMCYPLAAEIAQSAERWLPDTNRTWSLIEAAMRELGEQATAAALCAWSAKRRGIAAFPDEIEWELTTRDPLPETTLRPRGSRVPPRELTDLDALSRIAAELVQDDAAAVVLGGHGDPLLHPRFAEICARIRAAGVHTLGVVSPLVELPDAAVKALFEHHVDLLEVTVDAHTRETYQFVHGVDAFERVTANLERLDEQRRRRSCPQPILAPSMTRCAATATEIDSFYDAAIRRHGTALLRGYNDFAGVLPPDTLIRCEPLVRGPCRRLTRRLMLLADGTATACSQDIRGAHPIGRWDRQSLSEIWHGEPLRSLREAHISGRWSAMPICVKCTEWPRP